MLDFQFTLGNPPFWNIQNVLTPEGRMLAYSSKGPIVFTYVLSGLEKL